MDVAHRDLEVCVAGKPGGQRHVASVLAAEVGYCVVAQGVGAEAEEGLGFCSGTVAVDFFQPRLPHVFVEKGANGLGG